MKTDTTDGRGLLARLRRASNGAPRQRGRLTRRLGSALRLTAALTLAGGLYIAIAPASQAQEAPLSAAAQDGKAIYDQSCISCHGRNAQGVTDRGPSLIGVGSAAVEFQVSSGRMPLARQEAQAERKQPMWEGQELVDKTAALSAYIQELGGGPQVPAGNDFAAQGAASANGEGIARGNELFRINCSSCHAFSGGGGALSSGKYAPSLQPASDRQIYAAMLSGPQNMPVFGDNQLTPEQKMQIIAYVQSLNADNNPGGWGLGRFGPVTEGLAIFLVGVVALVFASLWIAGKS